MTNYLDFPVGDKAPDIITAVIEIPQGGINKYEYDKDLHVFRLDRAQALSGKECCCLARTANVRG